MMAELENPVFEPDDWEEDIGDGDVDVSSTTTLHDPDVDGMT